VPRAIAASAPAASERGQAKSAAIVFRKTPITATTVGVMLTKHPNVAAKITPPAAKAFLELAAEGPV
jgi:hypothetical protein